MTANPTPSRRALIAGSAATALVSAPVIAVARDADAELLALRPAWQTTKTAFDAALKVLAKAETARDRRAVAAAQKAEETTCAVNIMISERLTALPATTLAGLRFKAEVSADQDHTDEDLIRSIMEDIAAISELRPA